MDRNLIIPFVLLFVFAFDGKIRTNLTVFARGKCPRRLQKQTPAEKNLISISSLKQNVRDHSTDERRGGPLESILCSCILLILFLLV